MPPALSTYARLHVGLAAAVVLFLLMAAVAVFSDRMWLFVSSMPVFLITTLLLMALCRCKACGESPMRMGRIDSVCRRCGADLKKQF